MDPKRRRRRVSYVIGQPDAEQSVLGGVNCVRTLSGDRESVATGGRDGVVRTWNIASGKPTVTNVFDGHLDWINDLACVPNSCLASCSSDSQIKIWSLPRSALVNTISPHSDYAKCLAFNPHIGLLFSGSLDGTLCGVDVQVASTKGNTAKGVFMFAELYKSVYSLATHSSLVAAGTTDDYISIVDWKSGRLAMKLLGHKNVVRHIAWAPHSDTMVVSCSSDATIRFWDLRMESCLFSINRIHRQNSILSMAFLQDAAAVPGFRHDGSLAIFSGARDGTVCLTLADRSISHSNSPLHSPNNHVNEGSTRSVATALVCAPRAAVTAMGLSCTSPPPAIDDQEDADVTLDRRPSSPTHRHHLWLASSSPVQPISVYSLDNVFSSDPIRGFFESSSSTPTAFTSSPQSISPSTRAADGALVLHHLAPSHVDRHAFSLSVGNTSLYAHPARQKQNAECTREEDEQQQTAAHVHSMGCAVASGCAVPSAPPVIKAKVLDNKRHCLALDSEGTLFLWDLTSCSLCEVWRNGELDKKAQELNERYPKVALSPWCTLDVTRGFLAVLLDHPSSLNSETTAWERDSASPLVSAEHRSLAPSGLSVVKAEKPSINIGESVLLGLFARLLDGLPHKILEDPGDISLDPHDRAQWFSEQLAHERNAGLPDNSLIRVRFKIPEDVAIAVWSRREGGPHPRQDPPGVGAQVVYAYEGEPYHPHSSCKVAETSEWFTVPNDLANQSNIRLQYNCRLPTWVCELIESRDLPANRSHNIFFMLESCDRELHELPAASRRLSGGPRVRIFKIAEEVTKGLKLKLPSLSSWEDSMGLPVSDTGSAKGSSSQRPGTPPRVEHVAPEQYIQLLAGDVKLDPLWSLGTVDRYYRHGKKELVIRYRIAAPHKSHAP
ncbi:WD repeat-containing protein 48-like protein [Diplonema papillatum]|nr:WD repeat-containing protein 48-like protein [Diplonema papillatum]